MEEENCPCDPKAFIFNKIKKYATAMRLIQVGMDKTKITKTFLVEFSTKQMGEVELEWSL